MPTHERRVIAVCCFKADKYQWFDLPRPMTKRAAQYWARKNIDMPVENFRYEKVENGDDWDDNDRKDNP